MMNLEECIKTRRSIRAFTEEKISRDRLEKIIEICRYSPSWKNSQIVRYTVIEDKALINKIAEECTSGFAYNEKTIKGSGALVVLSYVKGICGFEKDGSFTTSKEDRWEMFDAGIAAQTFCLAAYDKGIGSVIMGIFDDDEVAGAISLPLEQKVAALIAIGYPNHDPQAPKRKDVDELVSFI